MLYLSNYMRGALKFPKTLFATMMRLNSAFCTIILVLLLSVCISDYSAAFCQSGCETEKLHSNNTKLFGDYSPPILQSYQIAQAILDTTEMDDENQGVQKGTETEVETETGVQDYDSLLLEAAKYAEKQNGAASSAKDWEVFISIYLWLSGLNGDIGIGNSSTDLDVSFGDIWDNFDVGAQLHIEFWWKRWLVFIDPSYVKLSTTNRQTNDSGSIKANSEVKQFIFEFAGGYRVAEIPLSSSPKDSNGNTWPQLNVDVYGGGRIFSLDSTIRLTQDTPEGPVRETFNRDKSWFDFIVGTRLLFNLTENLLFTTKTDIGGFGLGFSSDISWNFVTNIGYELPWWGVTPYLGYRVLYIDYEDGSGDNRFVYDVWQTGPQIGIGFQF